MAWNRRWASLIELLVVITILWLAWGASKLSVDYVKTFLRDERFNTWVSDLSAFMSSLPPAGPVIAGYEENSRYKYDWVKYDSVRVWLNLADYWNAWKKIWAPIWYRIPTVRLAMVTESEHRAYFIPVRCDYLFDSVSWSFSWAMKEPSCEGTKKWLQIANNILIQWAVFSNSDLPSHIRRVPDFWSKFDVYSKFDFLFGSWSYNSTLPNDSIKIDISSAVTSDYLKWTWDDWLSTGIRDINLSWEIAVNDFIFVKIPTCDWQIKETIVRYSRDEDFIDDFQRHIRYCILWKGVQESKIFERSYELATFLFSPSARGIEFPKYLPIVVFGR